MNNLNTSDHLSERIALVTGASRGIGHAIVAKLLSDGMTVVATARHENGLEKLAAEFTTERLFTIVADLSVPQSVDELIRQSREHVNKIDLLVNNAGIGIYDRVEDISLQDWETVMDVNARGAFLLAQHVYRWMIETGGGRIINISSVVGHKGYENQLSYTASKHALMGMTKVMAREGQEYGIRVSAICPGGVATDMVKQARPDLDTSGLIQPADVARAVHYLATEPETCCTDVLYLRRAGSTPFA